MNNISVTLQVKTNHMIGAFWRKMNFSFVFVRSLILANVCWVTVYCETVLSCFKSTLPKTCFTSYNMYRSHKRVTTRLTVIAWWKATFLCKFHTGTMAVSGSDDEVKAETWIIFPSVIGRSIKQGKKSSAKSYFSILQDRWSVTV